MEPLQWKISYNNPLDDKLDVQVADQYAFIPREAVSRFLIHCVECQRKPSLPTDIKPELEGECAGVPQLSTPPATPPSEPCPLPDVLAPRDLISQQAAMAYAQVTTAADLGMETSIRSLTNLVMSPSLTLMTF